MQVFSWSVSQFHPPIGKKFCLYYTTFAQKTQEAIPIAGTLTKYKQKRPLYVDGLRTAAYSGRFLCIRQTTVAVHRYPPRIRNGRYISAIGGAQGLNGLGNDLNMERIIIGDSLQLPALGDQSACGTAADLGSVIEKSILFEPSLASANHQFHRIIRSRHRLLRQDVTRFIFPRNHDHRPNIHGITGIGHIHRNILLNIATERFSDGGRGVRISTELIRLRALIIGQIGICRQSQCRYHADCQNCGKPFSRAHLPTSLHYGAVTPVKIFSLLVSFSSQSESVNVFVKVIAPPSSLILICAFSA